MGYKKIIPVSNPVITDNDAKYVYKVTKSGWVSSSGKEINLFETNKSYIVSYKKNNPLLDQINKKIIRLESEKNNLEKKLKILNKV